MDESKKSIKSYDSALLDYKGNHYNNNFFYIYIYISVFEVGKSLRSQWTLLRPAQCCINWLHWACCRLDHETTNPAKETRFGLSAVPDLEGKCVSTAIS